MRTVHLRETLGSVQASLPERQKRLRKLLRQSLPAWAVEGAERVQKLPRKISRNWAALLPGIHQLSNKTGFDRYPQIFAAATTALPNPQRILSFGCSTGEECVTLQRYFPFAEITGADINPINLLKAMKRGSDRIRFVYANEKTLSSRGLFDAIFCLTVLRDTRLDALPSIREAYPFERFDERVRFLHSLLRPQGLMIFYGNMYRFCDTTVANYYEVIPLAHTPHGKNITFARDGTNDGGQYLDVLFWKRPIHSRPRPRVSSANIK
jgi:hypothetical protein